MEVIEQRVLEQFCLAAHLGGAYVEDGHEDEHTDDQWDEHFKLVLVHEFHNAFCRVGPRNGGHRTTDERCQQPDSYTHPPSPRD